MTPEFDYGWSFGEIFYSDHMVIVGIIAKSVSSVGQGQHEISIKQMVPEDALYSLLGHLFRVVTSWSLSEELGKND